MLTMQMGWERVLLPSQNRRSVEGIPENGVRSQSPVAIIQREAEPVRYAMRTDSLACAWNRKSGNNCGCFCAL